MKRGPTKYTNVILGDIYKHYGVLFWQECFFCGQDFRREQGYRFQLQMNRDWIYSCAGCCSSKEEVNDKVGEFKKRRPKAPPAPPRKKSNKTPQWLEFINQLTPCEYCGTVAGPCLGDKIDCKKVQYTLIPQELLDRMKVLRDKAEENRKNEK